MHKFYFSQGLQEEKVCGVKVIWAFKTQKIISLCRKRAFKLKCINKNVKSCRLCACILE